MSFRRLLDRTVTVVPRVVVGHDDRGNEVLADGTPILGVGAARDQLTAEEDVLYSDRLSTRWRYFLALFGTDDVPVAVDGYSRIEDGAEVLHVLGKPELITRRRRPHRPHHWELVAEEVT